MRMRLKPLRGQTYESTGREVVFIERINMDSDHCRVYDAKSGKMDSIHIDDLNLPIIDTKDYEKIVDEKYKGD